jgi:hypothetical protein
MSSKQDILWRQFPRKPDTGFVLGVQRQLGEEAEGEGTLFLRDLNVRKAGTLLANVSAQRLVEAMQPWLPGEDPASLKAELAQVEVARDAALQTLKVLQTKKAEMVAEIGGLERELHELKQAAK